MLAGVLQQRPIPMSEEVDVAFREVLTAVNKAQEVSRLAAVKGAEQAEQKRSEEVSAIREELTRAQARAAEVEDRVSSLTARIRLLEGLLKQSDSQQKHVRGKSAEMLEMMETLQQHLLAASKIAPPVGRKVAVPPPLALKPSSGKAPEANRQTNSTSSEAIQQASKPEATNVNRQPSPGEHEPQAKTFDNTRTEVPGLQEQRIKSEGAVPEAKPPLARLNARREKAAQSAENNAQPPLGETRRTSSPAGADAGPDPEAHDHDRDHSPSIQDVRRERQQRNASTPSRSRSVTGRRDFEVHRQEINLRSESPEHPRRVAARARAARHALQGSQWSREDNRKRSEKRSARSTSRGRVSNNRDRPPRDHRHSRSRSEDHRKRRQRWQSHSRERKRA